MELHIQGKERVDWAKKFMPVIEEIETRIIEDRMFENKKIGMCLHITPETAIFASILDKAGAKVTLTASNPISTHPDIVEYLKHYTDIDVLGFRGMSDEDYKKAIAETIKKEPDYVVDDGAELIREAHRVENTSIKGATEETSTGYFRLLKYEEENTLKFPVMATSFSFCHNLFDNKHGTSQSVIDGLIRATNSMIAGKTVVVIGYGQCGATFAKKIHGMGAQVIVCEVNPKRALEAALDGYKVSKLEKACLDGDIFCTFTGNINVIRKEHYEMMKDNVIVCNAGHLDVELDLLGLTEISEESARVREYVREYKLKDGRSLNILSDGRIINMTAADGHPASVMDISFSLQLLALELFIQDDGTMPPNLYEVPEYIDESISNLKLHSLGMEVDDFTHEQLVYLENNELAEESVDEFY